MARIRTIKPSFFTSLTIADLTPEQRLTFIGLWTHSDDEGRSVYEPRLIKAAIWPLDNRSADAVASDVQALTESSLITHYIVSERSYLMVNAWHEHQKINRPVKSALPGIESGEITPPTCGNEDSVSTHGGLTEDSPWERKGKERKGSEKSGADAPDLSIRDDVETVCAYLADQIEANGSKRPAITNGWRNDARLLIDRDKRTVDQIVKAVNWSQRDPFWKQHIMSMSKLRAKYDQLRLAAADKPRAGTVYATRRGEAVNGDRGWEE